VPSLPETSRKQLKNAILGASIVVLLAGAVIGAVLGSRAAKRAATTSIKKKVVVVSDGSVRYILPTESSKVAQTFIEHDNSKAVKKNTSNATEVTISGDDTSSGTGKLAADSL